MREIDKILDWAEIAPIDSRTAFRARSFDMPDFEDAMQCATAENCFADIIVTRNTKDFMSSPVPAMTPTADSSGQRNRGWRGEDVIWGGIVEAFSRT
jgi:hypothetical protein